MERSQDNCEVILVSQGFRIWRPRIYAQSLICQGASRLCKSKDYEDRLKRESVNKAQQDPLDRIAEQKAHDQDEDDDEDWEEGPSGYTDFTQSSQLEGQGPCVRVLEGHSKSVTSLYYEDGCLVSVTSLSGLGGSALLISGDRIVRQDHSTMGRSHGSMRTYDGYSLGDFEPTATSTRTTSTKTISSLLHVFRLNSL
jgi:hypothetical protein